jgi:di/tricarboxylate transporter
MPTPQPSYRRWFAAVDLVLMVVCLVLAWNTLQHWHGTTTNRYLFAAVYVALAIFFGARSWRRRQRPPG